MQSKFQKLYPRYTYFPLFFYFAAMMLSYYLTKVIASNLYHYDITTAADRAIPFVPAFILFYVLAYIQWLVDYTIIARESKEACYRIFSGEILAKAFCFLIFILFPTTMVRANVNPNDGLFCWMTNWIYHADEPTNLFPSIHCLESWICFRGVSEIKRIPKWFHSINLLFSILVFASTVFVKQHVLIDIAGGILLGELCLHLAKVCRTARFFEFFDEKIFKKH